MNNQLPHRIAAGGIIIHNDSVLLVRYSKQFLQAPGGGIEENESLHDTVIRECYEETGIIIKPKQLFVSELIIVARKCTVQKSWFICEYVSGTPTITNETTEEGIVETAWFTQESLKHEKVFPSILKKMPFLKILAYSGPAFIPPIRTSSS